MKNSCGAILYTFNTEGKIGVILGLEGSDEWLPFKGCNETGESFEQTAIREIKEETCGLVTLENISLDHVFTTKHKIYRIGLCQVDFSIIEQFEQVRKAESRKEFREKQEIKFFPLDSIFIKQKIHSISRASIKFYWDKLMTYAGKQHVSSEYIRCHGMTEEQVSSIRMKALTDIDTSTDTTEVDIDNDIMKSLLKLDIIKKSDIVNSSPDCSDESQESSEDTHNPSKNKSSNDRSCKNTKHDLFTFLIKRDSKYLNRKKSTIDSRGYCKREYNLPRPRKINMYNTPMAEKRAEENRTWR